MYLIWGGEIGGDFGGDTGGGDFSGDTGGGGFASDESGGDFNNSEIEAIGIDGNTNNDVSMDTDTDTPVLEQENIQEIESVEAVDSEKLDVELENEPKMENNDQPIKSIPSGKTWRGNVTLIQVLSMCIK